MSRTRAIRSRSQSPEALAGLGGELVPSSQDARPAAASWRIPYARARQALHRMRRHIRATRRVIELRERFALGGTVESRQQLRILHGETRVDGWLQQALTCLNRAVASLYETNLAQEQQAEAATAIRNHVTAGVGAAVELTKEALALNARLEELAVYSAEVGLFHGISLPAPEPECTKLRRRRVAAAAKPLTSRRQRRRLIKAATVLRRVMRGRAPPPFSSLTR